MKKKNILRYMDKTLLIFSIIYSLLGIIIILSASSVSAVLRYDVGSYYFFIRQIIYVVIGLAIGFFIILKFPTKRYKYIIHILLFALLVSLVLLLIYGSFTGTSKRWISLGFLNFQPSEYVKLTLIIYMGTFFGELQNKKLTKYSFLIPLIYCFTIIVLIGLQPDLGTVIIILGILFLTFLAIPFKGNTMFRVIKIMGGAVAIIAVVFLLSGTKILTEEQQSRLMFREPCDRYMEKTGYQVCNGMIAINGGGLFGKGLGNSTQKYLYLPESHTDFIFPILVEELGAIVGVLVIIGYLIMLYRILVIARSCYELRNSIICYGIFALILLHLIVNFCGILALIPLSGVPLPLLSFSGNFTLIVLASLFIVQRICVENKITKEKIEISRV